ncbi:hypothetical protein C8J57DRAFT_461824 [Mycena rebaudengoi]|nr:hypothetical protein C8J57DRAFT_461824 [Mycena rebaudengoi]
MSSLLSAPALSSLKETLHLRIQEFCQKDSDTPYNHNGIDGVINQAADTLWDEFSRYTLAKAYKEKADELQKMRSGNAETTGNISEVSLELAKYLLVCPDALEKPYEDALEDFMILQADGNSGEADPKPAETNPSLSTPTQTRPPSDSDSDRMPTTNLGKRKNADDVAESRKRREMIMCPPGQDS